MLLHFPAPNFYNSLYKINCILRLGWGTPPPYPSPLLLSLSMSQLSPAPEQSDWSEQDCSFPCPQNNSGESSTGEQRNREGRFLPALWTLRIPGGSCSLVCLHQWVGKREESGRRGAATLMAQIGASVYTFAKSWIHPSWKFHQGLVLLSGWMQKWDSDTPGDTSRIGLLV